MFSRIPLDIFAHNPIEKIDKETYYVKFDILPATVYKRWMTWVSVLCTKNLNQNHSYLEQQLWVSNSKLMNLLIDYIKKFKLHTISWYVMLLEKYRVDILITTFD